MKKMLLAVILAAAMVSLLPPSAAVAQVEQTELDISRGDIIIGDGTVRGKDRNGNEVIDPDPDGYIIMQTDGSTTANTITVTGSAHDITLNGVNINTGGCAFSIADHATVNLTLKETNILKSGENSAGLQVPENALLTIDGTGSLTAIGGDTGAGIGGGFEGSGGTVEISGGTVTAMGGYYASGIGGGSDGSGGTVIITGGMVTGTGGDFSAGIGGGVNSSGGTVEISGGTVTAMGVSYGAGIGDGSGGSGGTVEISGGSVKASSITGTPTNDNDANVYLTTLTLDGARADTPIASLQTTDDYDHGINDVKTLDTDKLYLYLPENTVVESATTRQTPPSRYTNQSGKDITTASDGTAAGTLSLIAITVKTNGMSYDAANLEAAIAAAINDPNNTTAKSLVTITSIEIKIGIVTAADWDYIKKNKGSLTSLESLKVDEAITSAAALPVDFLSDSSIEEVDIDIVTSIGDYAFRNCASLTTTDFPVAEDIGNYAFDYCKSLKTADFPNAASIGGNAFNGCATLTTATFPQASIIGNYAFKNCDALTTLNFPEATKIGIASFADSPSISSASFPKAVKIGSWAFSRCGLSTLSLPSSPPNVGEVVFNGCPFPRLLTLVNADGDALTGQTLNDAIDAYKAVDDDNASDDLWYAWSLPVKTYTVELTDNDTGITDLQTSSAATPGDSDWTDYTTPVSVSHGGSLWVKAILDAGYTFEKWADTITDNPYQITGIEADVNYTPTSTADTYTITYMDGADPITGLTPTSYTYGVGATLPTTVDKTDYSFGGWYESDELTGNSMTAIGIDAAENKTCYAKFTANKYTVIFDKNAADATGSMANQTFTYNAAQNLTPNSFTRAGYTFAGWATSSTGAVAYADGVSVSNLANTDGATVTLYARWTVVPDPVTDPDPVVIYDENGNPIPCKNLQEALDKVKPGQTIVLYSGQVIDGELRIPDGVTLNLGGNALTCDTLTIDEGATLIIGEGELVEVSPGFTKGVTKISRFERIIINGTLINRGSLTFIGAQVTGNGMLDFQKGSLILKGKSMLSRVNLAKGLTVTLDESFISNLITGLIFLPGECYEVGYKVITFAGDKNTSNFWLGNSPDDIWFIDSQGRLDHDPEPGVIIPEYLVVGKGVKTNAAFLLPWNYKGAVSWQSGDEKVLKIVKNGKKRFIKGVELGKTTLTATFSDGETQIIPVTVVPKKQAASSVGGPDSIKLMRYEVMPLAPKVKPAGALDVTLFWHSSDEDIATVYKGSVLGVKNGTCRVVAVSTSGKRKVIKVTVTKKPAIEDVMLAPYKLTLKAGEQFTLIAAVIPDDADQTLKWSSDNPKIASVKKGVVTGKKAGTATITCKFANGAKLTCAVTVTE